MVLMLNAAARQAHDLSILSLICTGGKYFLTAGGEGLHVMAGILFFSSPIVPRLDVQHIRWNPLSG